MRVIGCLSGNLGNVDMVPTQYFTIDACRKYGFSYIYAELTSTEAAPVYESEEDGLAELEKVLSFVRNDDYYSSFHEKSAYLICSIAGSQYFSNGNKRLGITVLLMFLMLNDAKALDNSNLLKTILLDIFPLHVWEENSVIRGAHSLFLYNLAIVIGDRTNWGTDDFKEVQSKVATMFNIVHTRV